MIAICELITSIRGSCHWIRPQAPCSSDVERVDPGRLPQRGYDHRRRPPPGRRGRCGHAGLVGHWDPDSDTTNELLSVSCTSSDWCMSVGDYNDGVTQPMAAIWNGRWWHFGAAPVNPNSTLALLLGVSCVSPTNCIAVGYYENSSSDNETLVESWNGIEWSIASSASPRCGRLQLSDVFVCRPVGLRRRRQLLHRVDERHASSSRGTAAPGLSSRARTWGTIAAT